jgi:hypothetical protein
MLAIALGHKAVHAGYRVYYTTAADLVTRTAKAALEGRWQTMMRFWNGPQLLIIDELGYLPMPGEAASHLFQVITRRYEHGSIILTTNRGIADWGEMFEDATVAVAILDRLLHHPTAAVISRSPAVVRARRPDPSKPLRERREASRPATGRRTTTVSFKSVASPPAYGLFQQRKVGMPTLASTNCPGEKRAVGR